MLMSVKNMMFIALACVSASAFAQVDTRAGALVAVSPIVMPQSSNPVLHDQTSNAVPPLGASAQQLLATPGTLDTQAADDIVITDASGWSITQINFVVATDNGKNPAAQAASVNIVADGNGLPNDKVLFCQANNVVPTFNTSGNVMSVIFPTVCKLPAGHYWVELQALSNFSVNGNFVWEARTTQSDSPAVWRNPGGHFPGGPACPSWATLANCQIAGNFVGHVVAPDLLFQVLGARIEADPPALPALSLWSVLVLSGLLALFAGLPMLRTPR
ncbi:hypothetical protein ELE36_01755 [Pseudolysobacter antarcticus]|uniref:IPTL-CTERM sorting domain-containing protein n=1 Tax=Pseudolysobacter antarcticus TaxID=2511995 RepID=A0A411HFE8_9GAMM|nr:hypothetical protein [Pseudolysobacter antarcticus]QBB69202.1 hypothetical protein ELE36_01755 [Pseudolysobacter antarcticus]